MGNKEAAISDCGGQQSDEKCSSYQQTYDAFVFFRWYNNQFFSQFPWLEESEILQDPRISNKTISATLIKDKASSETFGEHK